MTWRKREIEAMKLALEALKIAVGDGAHDYQKYIDAVTALKEALAQPEQTEVQRLIALVRAQQITIDKLEMALAQPDQEPVACKHEWFRTGAMQLWEYRCINCGAEAKLMEKNNDS